MMSSSLASTSSRTTGEKIINEHCLIKCKLVCVVSLREARERINRGVNRADNVFGHCVYTLVYGTFSQNSTFQQFLIACG